MEPHEFKEAISALGYTQEGFAIAVGAGARSGQRWATEAVSPVVATLVKLLTERPELVAVLEKMRGRESVYDPQIFADYVQKHNKIMVAADRKSRNGTT